MSKKTTPLSNLLLLLTSFLVILLSACSFTTIRTPEVMLTQVVVIPRDDPTQTLKPIAATLEPPLLPSSTPAAVDSNAPAEKTQTPITVPANLAELRLMFWNMGVLYDANLWQPGGRDYMSSITHRRIPDCVLHEQGPTEPPPIDGAVILGDVEYQVSELLLSGDHVDWYMGVRNADGYFAGGKPTLVVRSTSNERDACLAEAEIVLATLAQFPAGVSGRSPSSQSTATGGCPGAPPQQVGIGDQAYVCTKSDHVVLRERPNRSADMLRYLAPGTTMTVIGGPSCANDWSWWNVRTEDDVVGWIAEGGDRVDPYFICLGP